MFICAYCEKPINTFLAWMGMQPYHPLHRPDGTRAEFKQETCLYLAAQSLKEKSSSEVQ